MSLIAEFWLSGAVLAGVAVALGVAAMSLGGPARRWRRWRARRDRVQAEDALKHIHQGAQSGQPATLQSLAGALHVPLNAAATLAEALQRLGWIRSDGSPLQLTAAGEAYAAQVVRAHRLWEQHLAEQTGVAEEEWHRQAERQEHFLSPADMEVLAARLGHPLEDPHGDPIPGTAADPVTNRLRPLATLSPGEVSEVAHVEDEPESVFRKLVAAGVHRGVELRMLGVGPEGARVVVDGTERLLPALAVANVGLLPEEAVVPRDPARSLTDLKTGQRGRVLRLSSRCRGAERRRLMDLGILPGTTVVAELESPAGGLTAYRVRDTLIALRREQGALILVHPEEAA